MRPVLRSRSGLTIVEIVMAVAVLTVGLLAVMSMDLASINQVARTRQRSVARLAAITCREAMETQQFRKLSTTDSTYFLVGTGGASSAYTIAWNSDGTAYKMPNCDINNTGATITPKGKNVGSGTTVTGPNAPSTSPTGYTTTTPCPPYAAKVDGIDGCICVEFPVPPLQAPVGRRFPGRIVFYLDEATMPTNPPTSAFPFPATPGLTFLDCDGDGAQTTTDLRGDYVGGSPGAYYLMPVRISVDWDPAMTSIQNKQGSNSAKNNSCESYTTYFMLSYRGYD